MSESFYRAPNRKWYRDEETYQKWQASDNARRAAIELVFTRFLGYPLGEGVKFPTLLSRKVQGYEKAYGYEILLQCLQENAVRIEEALQWKDLPTDNAKLSYLFAIVDSYINGTKRRASIPVSQTKRPGPPDEIHELSVKHKERDVRKWLDDAE